MTVTAETYYCYNVRAINDAGESAWAGEACDSTPAAPEPPKGWVAYNDLNPHTGDQNASYVTEWDYNASGAALVDSITTLVLPVTITGTIVNGYDPLHETNGGQCNSGTEAGDWFGPSGGVIVDLQNTIEIDEATWANIVTFDNLDPAKMYKITLSANRHNPDYANQRYATVTIEGTTARTNTSSSGVIVYADTSVSFSVGYNTVNGYVAEWSNIAAGPDGSFSIRNVWDTSQAGTKGYAMSAFRLQEIDTTLAPQYTVAVTAVGNGSVTRDPDQALYDEFETVELTALPDSGWVFTGWSGDMTGSDNPDTLTVTANMSVTATFDPDTIYTIAVTTVGNGTVTLDPDSASYDLSEPVELTALPDSGWVFTGWSGDLTGSLNPDTLTVTGDMAVTAHFAVFSTLTCEDYESGFTISQTVGSHADWFDNGGGPVVTAGAGVNSSVGLAAANNIFTWSSEGFDWNDPDFESVVLEMDFESNTTGTGDVFNDDRVGWMIFDDDIGSDHIFGIQFDDSDNKIEGYWDGITGADKRPLITTWSPKRETWYRLWVKVSRLTATSARIDVTVHELAGDGTVAVADVAGGTIADTDLLGDDVPATKYFTASTIWPGYKNYNGSSDGAADNACYEVKLSPKYTITATADPDTAGIVVLTPDFAEYAAGDTVIVTAVPADTTWMFDTWSGDMTTTENPETLIVAGNTTVTAHFKRAPTAAGDPVPQRTELVQNRPNPFNPTTTIEYVLAGGGDVSLRVYDVKGRLVRTLVDGHKGVGVHAEVWNGRNDRGEPVASGVYFYRLRAGETVITKKAILLK